MIYKFLVETKDVKKSAFLWNMIAYTSNSFQSMILLLVISRQKNLTDAAIFSIAFTTASMLLYIGKYAVRNYQVSDVRDEYTYGEYVSARKITILSMFFVSFIYLMYCYLFKEYSIYKVICVILILGFRFVEAAEDVFHGNLQKNQRLDVASKIWGIRTLGYMASFIILYGVTGRLEITAAGSLLVTIILFLLLNHVVYDLYPREMSFNKKKVIKLLKNCFPLALSTFIMVYIGNSPKYAVDAVLTSEEQTCFNIVFMPVFVITLLGNYIYNPMVGRMAEFWKNGKTSELKKFMSRQIAIVILFSIIVIVGGKLFGIRILELLYKVTLDNYEIEFIFLMIAGGALAIFNFLIVIATIIRKQQMLQYISIVFAVAFLIGNKNILISAGTRQMCEYYAVIMWLMVIITLVLCVRYINNRKEEGKKAND